jgi:hypothetical protein
MANKKCWTGAFDVFLRGKNIDTVFYSPTSNVTTEEVKRSLVDHDGYDSRITVRRRLCKPR